MATGDCVLSLAVEGGVTKTITLSSLTRDKAKLTMGISGDADWQVAEINNLGRIVVGHANYRIQAENTPTLLAFTEAT